jgi:hypothetical protein
MEHPSPETTRIPHKSGLFKVPSLSRVDYAGETVELVSNLLF